MPRRRWRSEGSIRLHHPRHDRP